MKNISKIILVIVVVFISNTISAQNNTLFWMKHLPQSMNVNPAKQSDCKLFIDVLVLPNFSFNTSHSGFTLSESFKYVPEIDSFVINLAGIENVLNERNSINFETNFSVLNLGLSLQNDMFVTFGINYKVSESFEYPKALIELRRGNYRLNGTPLSFNFKQNFTLYREIYAGFSKELYGNISFGGRIKLLSGYANIYAKKMNIDWYTATHIDSTYDWTFNSDFEIGVASPIPWELQYNETTGDVESFDLDDDYLDNIRDNLSSLIFPGNPGLALDLGVEYKYNNRFLFSASVIDLGFINWKTNSATLTQEATFVFSGLDIGKYIGSLDDVEGADADLGEQIVADMIDTLATVFNPTIEELAYKTGLNTKIYLGANVIVNDWLDFGALYRGTILNSALYSSYTLSANLNFLKGWSYSASYSITDGLANNIGMGFAYKVGPFQMYFLTDNFAVPFWTMNESETADRWFRNTKRVNLSFGVNFLLCGNKHDIGLLE